MDNQEREELIQLSQNILSVPVPRPAEDDPPSEQDGFVFIFAGNNQQYQCWLHTTGHDRGLRPTQCHYINEADKLYGMSADNVNILDVVTIGTFWRTVLADHPFIRQFIMEWRQTHNKLYTDIDTLQ